MRQSSITAAGTVANRWRWHITWVVSSEGFDHGQPRLISLVLCTSSVATASSCLRLLSNWSQCTELCPLFHRRSQTAL